MLNNPVLTEDEYAAKLMKAPTKYLVFQLEVGESGTPHYQGYIEFGQQMRPAAVKKLCKHAHWEGRTKGTRQQARDYCRKDDKPKGCRIAGPWEWGKWTDGGQGARNDLYRACEVALRTFSVVDVIKEAPTVYVKYFRGIERLIARMRPKRIKPPVVSLLYGATRTGKTRFAYDHYPDLYRKHPSCKWFDGYEGQEVLLLDDFSGATSKVSLDYLLQLLDRYHFSPEVKGGFVSLNATRIIITTNNHPYTWYNYADRQGQYDALAERFYEVIWFPKFKSPPLLMDIPKFFHEWSSHQEDQQLCSWVIIPESSESSSDDEEAPRPLTQTFELTLSEDESTDLGDL